MNRQEILKLVREHFKGGGVCDDGSCTEYYGDPDAFVRFLTMYGINQEEEQ